MTTTTPPITYPPGSTPPHAEASLGSMGFNPKIPNESEEFYLGSLLDMSSSSPVGYKGETTEAEPTAPRSTKFDA